MRTRIFRFVFSVGLIAGAVAFQPTSGTAQDVHNHTPAVSGVPQGVPFFCANPTVRSIGSGAWSDSKIWSKIGRASCRERGCDRGHGGEGERRIRETEGERQWQRDVSSFT